MPSAPRVGAFQCDMCEKTFSRREYVDRHKRLKHLGVRPFECCCGSAYARSDLLRRHKKTCARALAEESPDGVNLPSARPRKSGPKGKKASNQASSNQSDSPGPATGSTSGSLGFGYGSTTSLNPPSLSPASTLDNSSNQSSPHTPYAITDGSSAPHMQGGPYSYVPVGFTQDELMATEVLEDLLRSPQFSKAAPATSASTTTTTTTSAAGGPGLTATANVEATLISPGVAQRSGFDFGPVRSAPAEAKSLLPAADQPSTLATQLAAYDQALGLEFSPEAAALADYFNKGGVGGITALDLGFTYEPTLFPSHLFESQSVHSDHDRKFHIPNGKFALGYAQSWRVPPTATLSRFASHAAQCFLPCIPVVHAESMVMNDLPPHTAFALTVAGAAYDPEGETFSNEMLVQKRLHLVKIFNEPGKTWHDRFACAQSLLLYQLLGIFHKDEGQRILSHTFHGAMIMMFRELDLVKKISESQVPAPPLGTPAHEVQTAWKSWIEIETWRRVAFLMYLMDLETATRFSCAPLLPFSEMTLDLPTDDDLWAAKNAEEWQRLYLTRGASRPVSFVAAVRALLSPSVAEMFGAEHAIFADISQLATLPLLVLTRTLAYLELKTEEAIRQSDPFRSMLNGIGMFDTKESENLDLLRRIKRGKSLLSMMPKAAKNDGNAWFECVMPNVPTFQQHTHLSMENHLKNASWELKNRWPHYAQEKPFV